MRRTGPPSSPASSSKPQTGPKTPAGKDRSSRNALKHGLTARKLVAPGEDPRELEKFVADLQMSLDPVGAAEEELALQVATGSWKLRRAEVWEAAVARAKACEPDPDCRASLENLDSEIRERRSNLGVLQQDPASKPPLVVRLPGMDDPEVVYGFEVNNLYMGWVNSLPEDVPIVPLAELAERSGGAGGGASRQAEPESTHGEEQDSPDEASPADADWTAGGVKKLVAEMAKLSEVAERQFYKDAEQRWKAGLQDARADLASRRLEAGRAIRVLERRRQDLLAAASVPEPAQLDLMARYAGAAQRARDKALQALLELQGRRRRAAAGKSTNK
jgi:hypothetical protein